MNDQILLDNYLLILKSTVEVYVHGTLESVNQPVRDLLQDSLIDIINMQSTTYDEMTKYGWYKIENVNEKEIQKTITKINNN